MATKAGKAFPATELPGLFMTRSGQGPENWRPANRSQPTNDPLTFFQDPAPPERPRPPRHVMPVWLGLPQTSCRASARNVQKY